MPVTINLKRVTATRTNITSTPTVVQLYTVTAYNNFNDTRHIQQAGLLVTLVEDLQAVIPDYFGDPNLLRFGSECQTITFIAEEVHTVTASALQYIVDVVFEDENGEVIGVEWRRTDPKSPTTFIVEPTYTLTNCKVYIQGILA